MQAGDGTTGVTIDGIPQGDMTILLVDDHREHSVEVRILVDKIIDKPEGI